LESAEECRTAFREYRGARGPRGAIERIDAERYCTDDGMNFAVLRTASLWARRLWLNHSSDSSVNTNYSGMSTFATVVHKVSEENLQKQKVLKNATFENSVENCFPKLPFDHLFLRKKVFSRNSSKDGRTPAFFKDDPKSNYSEMLIESTNKKEEFIRKYVDAVVREVRRQKLTMVSQKRLENVRDTALHVLERNIEGDFVETGTWKGGCSLVMRAANLAFSSASTSSFFNSSSEGRIRHTRRQNWLFDTFEGLPGFSEADERIEKLVKRRMDPPGSYQFEGGLQSVKKSFKCILNDDFQNLNFHKGLFKQTLSSVAAQRVKKIAVLRLDGDMYSSTMDVLQALYDKVVKGGFVIIDDYGWWPQCKQAVHDFFDKQRGMNMSTRLIKIDNTGHYFIKPQGY